MWDQEEAIAVPCPPAVWQLFQAMPHLWLRCCSDVYEEAMCCWSSWCTCPLPGLITGQGLQLPLTTGLAAMLLLAAAQIGVFAYPISPYVVTCLQWPCCHRFIQHSSTAMSGDIFKSLAQAAHHQQG